MPQAAGGRRLYTDNVRIFRLLPALFLALPAAAQLRSPVPELGRAPVALSPVSAYAAAPASALLLPPSLTPVALAPAAAPSAPVLIVPGAPEPARPAAQPVQLLLDLSRTPQEKEAANLAGAFDGAIAPRDGASVSPRIELPEMGHLGEPLMLAITRGAVEKSLPALRESVALGSWSGPHTTLEESCCGDAAPKLAALLRARGVPARLVEAEFHYYVMIETPETQIVVDPTIRQFFGGRKAPRAIPDVFVGTIPELNALYERFRTAKTTSYGPLRIYFSESYVRVKQLVDLERDIRRGGPRDLAPLRKAMGLPAVPSTPPAPPKLIVP